MAAGFATAAARDGFSVARGFSTAGGFSATCGFGFAAAAVLARSFFGETGGDAPTSLAGSSVDCTTNDHT